MRRVFGLAALLVSCTRTDPTPPPPAPLPAPVPVASAPANDAGTLAADRNDPPPPPSPHAAGHARASFFQHSITADGKLALQEQLQGPGIVSKHPFHLRTVDVATSKVVDDVNLEALAALPRETIDDGGRVRHGDMDTRLKDPEIAKDLVKAAKVIGRFPLGAAGRIAATADGSVIAFNAGDWIYVADAAGKPKKRVAELASYHPRFSPDGKWLFFDRQNGMLDKVVSKYELFVVPADLSAPPKRIDGTAEMRDSYAVGPDNTMRGVVTSEPIVKTCMVSVLLAPPFTAKKGPCFEPPNGSATTFVISPTGAWAAITSAWDTKDDDPNRKTQYPDGGVKIGKKQAWATRALRAADGKSFLVDDQPGKPILAISDDGVIVRQWIGRMVYVEDLPKGTKREAPTPRYLGGRAVFRNAKELVVEEDGARVFDVETMR